MTLSDDDLRAIWQGADAPFDCSACLTDAEWAHLLTNELGEAARARAAHHLGTCTRCAHEYRLLQPLQSWVADADATPPPRSTAHARTLPATRSWWSPPATLPIAAAAILCLVAAIVLAQLMGARRENAALQAQLAERDRALAAAQASASALEDKLRAAPGDVLAAVAAPGSQQHADSPTSGDLERLVAALENLGRATGRADASRRALAERMARTPPSLTGVITTAGTLLGTAGDATPLRVVAPVGTVVQDDRPTFRWQPTSGATRYTVAVYDASFTPVVTSPPLSTSEWRAAVPLARGLVYSWQVTAVRNGQDVVAPAPPAGEARFRVLDASKVAALAQAAEIYRDSPLRLAAAFVDEGLLDDAERTLRLAIETSPDPSLSRELLRSVQSIRQQR
jgi:hypothetical protein